MYPTYAAVLTLSNREDEGPPERDFIDLIRGVVETWCKGQVQDSCDSAQELRTSTRHSSLRQVTLHCGDSVFEEIREVPAEPPEGWASQIWLDRPITSGESCQRERRLRTDIQMCLDAAEPPTASPAIRVTIREHVAFQDGTRPSDRNSESAPPCSLLSALPDLFRVHQGNIEWTRSYWQVRTVEQVDALHRAIIDRQRTVPLVVCVGDEAQGPPIEPAELASDLFGTAKIVHIANPRLTKRLRAQIGERHRVGWNVIRLFRPGFSINDSPGMHRFFRRSEIDRYGDGGFLDWFSRYIRREESFLVEPDTVVRDRIRAKARAQSDRAQEVVESLINGLKPVMGDVDHLSLVEAITLILEDRDVTRGKVEEAEALASAYANELESAKDEKYRLETKVDSLEQRVSGAVQAPLPDDVLEEIPATIADAVNQVMMTIKDGEVEFHERVLKRADDYRGGLDPVQVRDMLITIRDVSRRCRDGHGDGRAPADYFREQGITLKTDISETAKQQFEMDYVLEVGRHGERRRVLMGPHINLSQRHRIYWHHDKQAQCFVIGHIGDHLRDATNN